MNCTGERRPAGAAARRVVLLGASNLTKSIGTVLDASAGAWGAPLDVMAALGHGRSYGRETRFFGLQLPGIEACGLWDDLAAGGGAHTAALVTDIGNDLLYEEPVQRIAGWVEQCLDRLAGVGAHTIVTVLPIDNLRTLSQARFRLLRTLFFPSSRISLAEVTRRANALDETVRRLAHQRRFPIVEHREAWYGFDPIHIRYRHRPQAWRDILSPWSAGEAPTGPAARALWRTIYLRTRTPRRRRVLGLEQRGRHPTARFGDGTSVAIY